MINYDYTFDIFSLSDKFYDDYSQDGYPELMRKDNRPYTCLLIQTEDYILAIPYRTDINIHNKNSFIFKNSDRSKTHRSGLDYQKIVIISNTDYLVSTGYSVDKDEYKETVTNIKRIVDESVGYVRQYIEHHIIKPMNKYDYDRAYKYSTLRYFHKELGIDSKKF